MKYVASKLSYQQEFTFYAPAQGGGPAIRTGGITVKGGCNVRDEHTLVLPTDGVITEITDEEATLLASHPVFKMYERNGAMKIVASERDGRRAARDLFEKDGSAQLNEKDFRKKGRKPPKAVAQAKADDEEEPEEGA